jgi:hypothetical protein
LVIQMAEKTVRLLPWSDSTRHFGSWINSTKSLYSVRIAATEPITAPLLDQRGSPFKS